MQRHIRCTVALAILLTVVVTSLSHAATPPPKPLIPIATTSNNETSPAAAYSSESKTYLVAYENNDHVQARLYDFFGNPVTQTMLDFGEGTYLPAVAYNNLHDQYGLTFVSDFTNYSTIVMCWLSGSSLSVDTCEIIVYGTPGVALLSPSIAFNNNDTNDDFLIVWQEGNLGDYSIYGQRATPTHPYSGVGSRIEIARTTKTPTHDEIFSAPDVTYNLNMNEYFVVFGYWTDDPSHTTGSDILGRRIRNDGSGPAMLPYIPVDTTDCEQSRPTVAAYRLNTNTPYFVAYEDDFNFPLCDSETSIRGIYLKQDGTPTTAYLNISATYQVREAHPDITASEALGCYTITWT